MTARRWLVSGLALQAALASAWQLQVDQAGYPADGPKRALVVGRPGDPARVDLIDAATGRRVGVFAMGEPATDPLSGISVAELRLDGWRKPGRYRLALDDWGGEKGAQFFAGKIADVAVWIVQAICQLPRHGYGFIGHGFTGPAVKTFGHGLYCLSRYCHAFHAACVRSSMYSLFRHRTVGNTGRVRLQYSSKSLRLLIRLLPIRWAYS